MWRKHSALLAFTAAILVSLLTPGFAAASRSEASAAPPYNLVGCTTNGACVAVGFAGGPVGTIRAEWSSSGGPWHPLHAARSPHSQLSDHGSSCWSSGCLFVGESSGRDAVWAFDASNHTLVRVRAPDSAAAPGVRTVGVNCFPAGRCVVADATPGDQSVVRLFATTNAGASWSHPRWNAAAPPSETLDGFSCVSLRDCLAVNVWACGCGFDATSTHDGGSTWAQGFASRNFPYATSLSCASLVRCVSVTANPGLEATANFGKSWRPQAPPNWYSPYLVSCATPTRCLLLLDGYRREQGKGAVAIGPKGGWRSIVTWRYTMQSPGPGPPSLSCGVRWCALLAVSLPFTFRE